MRTFTKQLIETGEIFLFQEEYYFNKYYYYYYVTPIFLWTYVKDSHIAFLWNIYNNKNVQLTSLYEIKIV